MALHTLFLYFLFICFHTMRLSYSYDFFSFLHFKFLYSKQALIFLLIRLGLLVLLLFLDCILSQM
jgi:hypothetical protein